MRNLEKARPITARKLPVSLGNVQGDAITSAFELITG